jgi:hypothetical protein
MSGLCRYLNRLFQHGWNLSWSKLSVLTYLEYVMRVVKLFRFSMTGMGHGQNCQFPPDWNVTWFKWSVSACLERVMVKIVSFSMSRISHQKNSKKLTVQRRRIGRRRWVFPSKSKKITRK